MFFLKVSTFFFFYYFLIFSPIHDWFSVRPIGFAPILFLFAKWLQSHIFGLLVLGIPCHMIYSGCFKVFQRTTHPSLWCWRPLAPYISLWQLLLSFLYHPHHSALCKLKERNQSELTAEFSSIEWKCWGTTHTYFLFLSHKIVCCWCRTTHACSASDLRQE